jgi:hypothetical protein
MLVLSGSHLGLRILAIEYPHEHASATTASILVPPDTDIETYLFAVEMLRMTSRDLNSGESWRASSRSVALQITHSNCLSLLELQPLALRGVCPRGRTRRLVVGTSGTSFTSSLPMATILPATRLSDKQRATSHFASRSTAPLLLSRSKSCVCSHNKYLLPNTSPAIDCLATPHAHHATHPYPAQGRLDMRYDQRLPLQAACSPCQTVRWLDLLSPDQIQASECKFNPRSHDSSSLLTCKTSPNSTLICTSCPRRSA